MRRLLAFALLCVTVGAFPLTSSAVTRTGHNSVKIPLSSGNVRISCPTGDPSCTPPSSGADITVCESGCTQLNTTAGITAALAAATAGEIIELRTVPAGTTETWAARVNISGITAGTPGLPILLRKRTGDTILFDTTGTLLTIANSDHVVIDGGEFGAVPVFGTTGLTFGDRAHWSVGNPVGYPQSLTSSCTNSTWIGLRGVSFTGGGSYHSNDFARSCNFVTFEDSACDLNGSNNDVIHGSNNWGNTCTFRSRHLRALRSRFAHGGHTPLSMFGSYAVARDVVASGDWTDKATGNETFRAAVFCTGCTDGDGWGETSTANSEFGPSLIENSMFSSHYNASPVDGSPIVKVHGNGTIFRGNYLFDNGQHAIQLPGYETMSGYVNPVAANKYLHIYQNTTFNTNAVMRANSSQFTNPPLTNDNGEYYVWLDNLHQQVHTGTDSIQAMRYQGGTLPLNGFAESWKGFRGESNIFGGDSANMQWSLTGTGAATVTITDSTTWPTLSASTAKIANNANTALTFVNAGARTKAGLALSAGSAIGLGDAIALTTTTDAGTADTTLTLADPRFFSDGWGMNFGDELGNDFENEPADWIAVTPTSGGAVATAVCTHLSSVNYSTGAIVVSPGVTHVNGSRVWFAGNAPACSIWKNRGAGQ